MADGLTDAVQKEERRQEEKGILRKAFDLTWAVGVSAAATALTVSTVGTVPLMVGAAFGGGGLVGKLIKGDASLYDAVRESLLTYATVTSIVHPMTLYGDAVFPIIGSTGSSIGGEIGSVVAKSGFALTGYLASFIGLYNATNHLFRNYFNPKGIGKSIATNFGADYGRFAWSFAPALLSTVNGMPYWFGLPAFAVNAFPAAIYHAASPPGEVKETKKYRTDTPAPQPSPALQPG